jgi:hypothetical protein
VGAILALALNKPLLVAICDAYADAPPYLRQRFFIRRKSAILGPKLGDFVRMSSGPPLRARAKHEPLHVTSFRFRLPDVPPYRRDIRLRIEKKDAGLNMLCAGRKPFDLFAILLAQLE